MKPKNLLILHLESIAWQTFNAYPEAFPNLRKVMPSSRTYKSYMSSATSTQMVLAYLFHANDFEFDSSGGLSKPAGNNPSLFSILQSAGYRTAFLCVTALHGKTMLPMLADTLGPVWSTNDFRELLEQFEKLTATGPFAIYAWNLVTHVEHALALAPYATGISDLVGGACAVADHALGSMLEILARKNLIDNTTIVIFGDHGDDYWTHGFKNGLLHGTEPYTHLVHAPLIIRDSSLPVGTDNKLASTIDFAPTCLDLLNLSFELPFAHSGQSLLRGTERKYVFSQNFTASQPDAPHLDVRKSFSANDHSHTLLVNSRGLELFNHRQDPTNHCNLLHFFDLKNNGELILRAPEGYTHPHFATTMRRMLDEPTMKRDFSKLREGLKEQIGKKHAYIAEQASGHSQTLDLSSLNVINRHGYGRFLDTTDSAPVPGIKTSARLLLKLVKNRISKTIRGTFR